MKVMVPIGKKEMEKMKLGSIVYSRPEANGTMVFCAFFVCGAAAMELGVKRNRDKR